MLISNNVLTHKEVNKLNQEDKRRYFRKLLLETLRLNPDGVTATALHRKLKESKYNYSEDTLRKHLKYLVMVREAYVTLHGNTEVFHLNGKLAWDTKRKVIEIGNKTYCFFELENPRGKFIFIQEREKDSYNIETVTGGIIVQKEHFPDFLSALKDFSKNMRDDSIEPDDQD